MQAPAGENHGEERQVKRLGHRHRAAGETDQGEERRKNRRVGGLSRRHRQLITRLKSGRQATQEGETA